MPLNQKRLFSLVGIIVLVSYNFVLWIGLKFVGAELGFESWWILYFVSAGLVGWFHKEIIHPVVNAILIRRDDRRFPDAG